MSIEVVLSSEHWEEPVRLVPGRTILIGRDPELVDAVLSVSGVSKRHCELACLADALIIRDLGSTNGSFLNGRWVSESRAHDGDQIGVGPKATLQVQITSTGPPDTCHLCQEALSPEEAARGGRYRDRMGACCTRCALSGAGTFERFGEYALLRQVGSGMTGRVFEALDTRDRNRVALKLLSSPPGDRKGGYREARFQREVEVLRRLGHPAIVHYHDSGQVKYQPYLAMEFVLGMDLGALLEARGRPFDPQELTPVVKATAEALSFAHEHGVVHRDIKPGNILIDTQGRVKLTDFGLARTVDSDTVLTSAGGILGTLEFMAPEQVRDAHGSDARADIYGLAATLFYLLSGKRPYAARNDYQLIANILDQPVPRLASHRPELPRIDELLAEAMAKNPDIRPQTPEEFARRWKEAAG